MKEFLLCPDLLIHVYVYLARKADILLQLCVTCLQMQWEDVLLLNLWPKISCLTLKTGLSLQLVERGAPLMADSKQLN